MANPKISIIVLNYNNYNDTRECLQSLKDVSYSNYNVVIIDSGSSLLISDKLEKEFPSFIHLHNDENLGYSGGNNLGIKYALKNDADYVLILNNDSIVTPNFLQPLIKGISKPGVAAVGPKIYRQEKPDLVQVPLLKINVWNGRVGSRWFLQSQVKYPTSPFPVAKLAGSCIMLSRNAIEDVGYFDDRFFLFYADTDLEERLRRKKWNLYSVPESIIYHKHSKTVHNDKLLEYYYSSRDFLFFTSKYYPHALLWCFMMSLIQKITRNVFFRNDGLSPFAKLRAILLGYTHFLLNRRGKQTNAYNAFRKEQKIFRYWLPEYNPIQHRPITQVSGICFNKNGEMLIIGSHHWNIPGGKPKDGETVDETLRREIYEEANIVIEKAFPLGVFLVIYPDNPNKKEGEIFYQLRYIVKIACLDEQTPDPADGKIRKRIFIKPEDTSEYFNWGEEAKQMFSDATRAYNRSLNL